RRGDQVHQEDGDAHPLAPLEPEPGQRVGGWQREGQGDRGNHQTHDQGVPDEGQVVGLPEQVLDVLERRRLVEPEGVVVPRVEVVRALEHADDGPAEREDSEEAEADRRQVEPYSSQTVTVAGLLPESGDVGRIPGHQRTSLRRASRRITAVSPTRTGNRNRATAAPCPRAPPSIPLKYAQVDRTWVRWVGPPRVST